MEGFQCLSKIRCYSNNSVDVMCPNVVMKFIGCNKTEEAQGSNTATLCVCVCACVFAHNTHSSDNNTTAHRPTTLALAHAHVEFCNPIWNWFSVSMFSMAGDANGFWLDKQFRQNIRITDITSFCALANNRFKLILFFYCVVCWWVCFFLFMRLVSFAFEIIAHIETQFN